MTEPRSYFDHEGNPISVHDHIERILDARLSIEMIVTDIRTFVKVDKGKFPIDVAETVVTLLNEKHMKKLLDDSNYDGINRMIQKVRDFLHKQPKTIPLRFPD